MRGDAAVAAKALRDYARTTNDLLAFKGGLLGRSRLDADQIRSIARLPARDVLYGQLVGSSLRRSPAWPVRSAASSAASRSRSGSVLEKKESGEIPPATRPPADGRRRRSRPPSPRAEPTAAAAEEEAPAAAEATTTETETQED